MSQERVRVLSDLVRGISVVEEPRVEMAGTRNDSGPSPCPLLALGGTNRTRGWKAKAPEKTENPGPSWGKLPRQESLKPRNSSGSLTS
jgi:hypothetical protein